MFAILLRAHSNPAERIIIFVFKMQNPRLDRYEQFAQDDLAGWMHPVMSVRTCPPLDPVLCGCCPLVPRASRVTLLYDFSGVPGLATPDQLQSYTAKYDYKEHK